MQTAHLQSICRTHKLFSVKVENTKTANDKQRRDVVKDRIFPHFYFAFLQRQITTAVLVVALAFVLTWVLPNQVIAILLVMYPNPGGAGATLKLRATMSLGLF